MKTSAIPIRCIQDKPHGIYDHCGSLLGAIDGDSVFFHCKNCSVWYSVYRDDNGALTIKPMDKDFRFDFQDELKIVEEA